MRTLGSVCCTLFLTGTLGLATGAVPAALCSEVWAQELPQSSNRSDLAIESDVLHRLGADPTLGGQQVSASTDNGVVTLSGSVAQASDRALAERVAGGVEGVRSVVNKITVGAASAAPSAPQAPVKDPTPEEDAAAVAAAVGGGEADGQEPAEADQPAEEASSQAPASAAPQETPRKPSPAVPVAPQSAPVQQPQAGAQGDWGQAGPPPDAQDGRIPPPTADTVPRATDGGQYPAPAQQGGAAGSGYPNSPNPAPYPGQYPATGRQRTSGYPPQSQPGYQAPPSYPQSQPQYPQGQPQYPQSQPYIRRDSLLTRRAREAIRRRARETIHAEPGAIRRREATPSSRRIPRGGRLTAARPRVIPMDARHSRMRSRSRSRRERCCGCGRASRWTPGVSSPGMCLK